MKNKGLLVITSLVLLMASCGGSTGSNNSGAVSSSKPTSEVSSFISGEIEEYALTEEMLAKLKVGYGFKANVTEKSSTNVTKNYVHEVAWLNDNYSIKVFDENAESPKLFETYSKDDNGNLLCERLNANNEKTFMKVYNPVSQQYFVWSDGYQNAFSAFTLNSFKKVEDNIFELNLEDVNLNTSFSALATQLYGNPGFTLSKFEMTVNIDGIESISASAVSSGKTSVYTYEYEISDISYGEDTKFFDRAHPFEEEGYAELDQSIAKLKNHNFTCDFKSTNGKEEVSTGTLVSNENGVYYLIESEDEIYSYGFLYTEDGVVEVEENSDGNFEIVEEYENFDIYAETLPSFNISSKCFTLNDGSYELKGNVEDDADVFFNTQPLVDELANFTIMVDEDAILMVNTLNSLSDEAMFTEFGKSELPFSKDTLVEPTSGGTWEFVLGTDYEALATKYGELMEALPLPEGHTGKDSWVNMSEEPEFDMLVSTVEERDINSDIASYAVDLEDVGFEKQDKAGENGGVLFYAYPEIDGTEVTVSVELVNFEDYLTIVLMILD